MINTVCGIRSTGRICTDIARELITENHEIRIAYGRENVPEEYRRYAVRIGTDFGIKLHGLKARLFDGAGFGSVNATRKFIKWVEEYNPDVIHLHNIHGYYINIELLFQYLKRCGKKVIWTLHDCWSFTGHCTYFDCVDCNKWKTRCHSCPQHKEYPRSYVDFSKWNWEKKRNLFTNVPNMTIVTPSKWLAVLAKNSFLCNYPITVINNGIDTNIFRYLESDIKEKNGIFHKKVILGVAAIWDRRKGLNYMKSLADKLGNQFQVVVIGVSEEQKKELPPNILGILRTENVDELVKWYSAADIFVNPTLEDNYPTTNLEAIACNTPVVTFRTGGSVESANIYGVSVEKGDVDALHRAILKMEFIKKRNVPTVSDTVEQYIKLY